MYAALRAIPIPNDVAAHVPCRLLLREHRGDGHIAALMIEGVSGLEAHVLFASTWACPRRSSDASTTSQRPSSPP